MNKELQETLVWQVQLAFLEPKVIGVMPDHLVLREILDILA